MKKLITNEAFLAMLAGLFLQALVLLVPETNINQAEWAPFVFLAFTILGYLIAGKDARIEIKLAAHELAMNRDLGEDVLGLISYGENVFKFKTPAQLKVIMGYLADELDKQLEKPVDKG